MPEFVQAAASSTNDAYRHRRKSNSDKKSAYQKKPTGLDKKLYAGPKEQSLYRAHAPANTVPTGPPSTSSSAFGDMLGFDPFQPPEILKSHSNVGQSPTVVSTPSYRQPTTASPSISKPYFTRSKKSRNKYDSSANGKKFTSNGAPKLAFDLDSGRVFDEKTGKWFRLVSDD